MRAFGCSLSTCAEEGSSSPYSCSVGENPSHLNWSQMTYLTSLVVLLVLKGSCTQTVRLTVKRVLRGKQWSVLIPSFRLYLDFTVHMCLCGCFPQTGCNRPVVFTQVRRRWNGHIPTGLFPDGAAAEVVWVTLFDDTLAAASSYLSAARHVCLAFA